MTRDLPNRKTSWKVISFQAVLCAAGMALTLISRKLVLEVGIYIALQAAAMLLCFGAVIPTLYRHWSDHGKSTRTFSVIVLLFVLVPLMVAMIGLADLLDK